MGKVLHAFQDELNNAYHMLSKTAVTRAVDLLREAGQVICLGQGNHSVVALAAWAIAFNFDHVWVSILGAVGANAFGAAVGALIGGFLADRFGRKFIYTYNLLVYAAGVFIIMCAVNLPMLCIGIVISGLSVGAGVPSSWSYISEMSSSTSRAANIGISQFAWSCGPAGVAAFPLHELFAELRFYKLLPCRYKTFKIFICGRNMAGD